jgi:hypothetical protein
LKFNVHRYSSAWVAEQCERLKVLHVGKFEEFRGEAELKVPRRPQFSKELLNQKHIQENLAKQRKYDEAEALRDVCARMEVAEMQATILTYEAEVGLKVGLCNLNAVDSQLDSDWFQPLSL